jgi:hypothetical protein
MPNKVQDFPALELPLTYRVSAESSLKFGGTRNVNETCLIAQHSESLRLLAIWSNQKGGERVPTKRERIGSSHSFCRVSEIASVENRSMREGGPCTTDDDPYLTRARKELGGGGILVMRPERFSDEKTFGILVQTSETIIPSIVSSRFLSPRAAAFAPCG